MTRLMRNSSFEFLKIIAIVCIVFCHSIPAERIEYHYATTDYWLFGVMIFRQLGSVGNAIFMVSSTWFLVDSDNTNLRKMKNMIADNQIISLIFLVLLWEYYSIDLKLAIKQVFPFLFSTMWYVTCYVMYYCLHGIINKALQNINLVPRLVMLCLFILNGYYFVLGGLYFSDLVGFIIAHVFTYYLKIQLRGASIAKVKKYGYLLLVIGILGWLLGAVILNYAGIHSDFIGHKFHQWNRFFNPFILILAYGSVLIASTIEVYSMIINKLSGTSLFVYMITGNQLLRIFPDNALYDLICSEFGTSMDVCFLFVLLYAIAKYVLGTGLAIVYQKTLGKATQYITIKECDMIENAMRRIK